VRVAPLSVVGAYGVAGRAVDMAYLIAKQATVALMPRLGDPAERSRAVRIGTGVFSGVIFSGMAALAIAGQELLVAWVGDIAAGETPAIVLALLALAAVTMSTYEVVSSMVMLSAPTGWSCAIPILIGSAASLAIAVAGASTYGVWAVAGSTVIGNAITCVLMWNAARPLLGWGLSRLLLALSPGLAAAVAAGGVGLALRTLALGNVALSLVVCTVTGLAGVGAAFGALRLSTPKSGS
jgi:O-antigen/teichoic acid export membrane protein